MTSTQRTAQTVRTLLEPVVTAGGRDLEEVTVTTAGRRSVVRVLIDADGGVSLDDIAHASQAVSAALDQADADDPSLFGESYTLEVSSRGVSRPLTEPRHWRRNAGRLVLAHLRSGSSVQGRIVTADDGEVVLDVDGQQRALPLEELERGLVQIEFRRPGTDAQADDDPVELDSGDDEREEDA